MYALLKCSLSHSKWRIAKTEKSCSFASEIYVVRLPPKQSSNIFSKKEGTALIGKSIAPEYLISITDFDRTVVALSFSPFLFLRYYDLGASRA